MIVFDTFTVYCCGTAHIGSGDSLGSVWLRDEPILYDPHDFHNINEHADEHDRNWNDYSL